MVPCWPICFCLQSLRPDSETLKVHVTDKWIIQIRQRYNINSGHEKVSRVQNLRRLTRFEHAGFGWPTCFNRSYEKSVTLSLQRIIHERSCLNHLNIFYCLGIINSLEMCHSLV